MPQQPPVNLLQTLQQAGFRGPGLARAWAHAMVESGGNPNAFNGNSGTGDRSWGLFQINTLGNLSGRVKQFGLKSERDLLDPATNARVAFQMSRGGTDFGPWTGSREDGPKFKGWMAKFPGAKQPGAQAGWEQPAAEAFQRGPAGLQQQAAAALIQLGQDVVRGGSPAAAAQALSAISQARIAASHQSNPVTSPGGGVAGQQQAPEGAWGRFVGTPETRQGPSAAHTPEMLKFVGQIGMVANKKLTPWGNESHSLTTVNGNRSAHADGNGADIPAKGAELIRLGRAALVAAGATPAWANKQTGGLFNIGTKQIIFNTNIGGDHTDHVHAGLRG